MYFYIAAMIRQVHQPPLRLQFCIASYYFQSSDALGWNICKTAKALNCLILSPLRIEFEACGSYTGQHISLGVRWYRGGGYHRAS